jgi:apolipoprotein N-acyltransferase
MDAQIQTLPYLAAVRSRVMRLSGWRRAAVAIVAGGLSALAFAPIFAFPVLFLTLPVFVWLIDASPGWRRAASAGWLFGFGYFFFNLFWIGEAFLVEADKFAWLLPFAVTLLPAGLALFWAAAAAGARFFWCEGIARVFVFAIALAVAEWLRGHVLTGFPWDLLGYALTYPLPLMQSAAIFGAYGLTAIAALVFPAPLVIVADRKQMLSAAAIARACAVAVVPIAVLYAHGAWRMTAPETFVPDVKLRIVQPSVPQREKWMAAYQRRIFNDHIALSLANPKGEKDSLAGITHLVWPEAAMPFFPLETPEALDMLSAMLPPGTTLITGAIRHDPPVGPDRRLLPTTKTLNSILALNERAGVEAIYDKIKLVPFGEYVPMESALSVIGIQKITHGRGAFAAGVSPRPLMKIPGLPPALGLVCYEALFPGEIVQGKDRPGVLINVTNDGWFGHSTGPYQHFLQSRVRAVEEGLPLVRAANNGISAVVDPYGRAPQTLDLDVRGVLDGPLPAALAPTVYARMGDWMLALVLAVFFAFAAGARKIRR